MLDGLMACIVPDSSTSPPSDPFTVRPVLVGCQQILIALGTLSNPLKKKKKEKDTFWNPFPPVLASNYSLPALSLSLFFDFPYHNDHF